MKTGKKTIIKHEESDQKWNMKKRHLIGNNQVILKIGKYERIKQNLKKLWFKILILHKSI